MCEPFLEYLDSIANEFYKDVARMTMRKIRMDKPLRLMIQKTGNKVVVNLEGEMHKK